MSINDLIQQAKLVQSQAYAPYSQYRVGVILEMKDGSWVSGCNVENASYGLTMCAERVAIGKAVTEGKHTQIKRAVVVGGTPWCTPCGACRQVLAEFNLDMEIIIVGDNDWQAIKLSDLLPRSFGPASLLK